MKATTFGRKLISVIIPAFNEQYAIRNCLKSLAKQDYKNIEIILVDDLSSDNTYLVARELANRLKLNMKIIRNKKHKERSVARNEGARFASGDYLLFIDADMYLDKKVISACMELIGNEQSIKAIIIPEQSFGEGFWADCRSLEKKCYIGDSRMEAARFFEKRAFWQVGGWDRKMISGEDWDLTRRIKSKYRIGRINFFIFHNELKLTLWKAIKKKFYYASVSGIYLEKTPLSILGLIFFVFRPAYLRNWRLIIFDSVHGAGMFFLKSMELFAGVAGYLFSKLPNRS